MSKRRVMVVEPHPDDTAIMAGGTIAKMSGDGDEIFLITVTDGERGTMDQSITSSEALRKITRKESEEASKLINIKKQVFFGYTNHDVTYDLERELKYKILSCIREFKPQIVMTYDPYGLYEPNPDHRTVSFATYDAVTFSHYHLEHPPEEKEISQSHIVNEIWFFNSPYPNFKVDITKLVDKKVAYMACYRSQMDSMITEVRLRLKSAGYTSNILESGKLEEILFGMFVQPSLGDGKFIEKFKIIRPFVDERVPDLKATKIPDQSM